MDSRKMATAGSIIVDLLARTGSFITDMDRARKKAGQFGNDIQQISARLDKAALSVAGFAAAGVAALTAMAVRTASAAEEIRNFSNVAGAPVVEFQRMAVAAEKYGIGQEKLADQLKDFNEKVGEFVRSGGGGMKDFFEQVAPKVGVTAEQFRKLSGPQGLQAYYNALEKAGLNQKEMSFYLESMASDTTALIPILRNGGEELNKLADRAQRFGFILSESSVEQAAQLNDALRDMQRVSEGVSRQLGIAMVPALQRGTQYAMAYAGAMIDASDSTSALDSFSESAVELVDDIGRAAAGIVELGRVVGDIFSEIDSVASDWLKPFGDQAKAATNLLQQSFTESVLNTAREIDKLVGFAGGVGAVWEAVTGNIPGYFELAWVKVLNTAAGFVNDLAGIVNPMLQALGMEGFGGVSWGKDVVVAVESLSDAFARGSREASGSVNAYGRVRDAIGRIAGAAGEAAGLLGGGGGSGGGGGGGGGPSGGSMAKAMDTLLSKLLPAEKALQDLHKDLDLLGKAYASGRVNTAQYTKALEALNLAYAKQANDLLPQSIKKAQEQVNAAKEQQKQLEQQLRTFGMAESAVLALAAADTDAAIAKLEAAKASEIADGASVERIKHIEEEIQALRELRDLQLGSAGLQGQLEWREKQREQWQAWAQDVKTIFDQVGQSLTDALFEGGKSARDLIKDLFKSLTLRVFIQPVMSQLQTWATNALGGLFGYQNPAQQGGGSGILGTAQNLYSGYNAVSGGLSNTLGNAAQWLGQKIGSEALTSFGLGLSGTTAATGIASIGAGLGASLGTSIGTSAAAMTTTSFSAALSGGALVPGLGVGAAGGGVGAGIGAAGAAGGAAAGGAAGIGSAIGAALPWIGGALAIGSLLGGGLFDREPTTRREQRTQVEYSGGALGITSRDDRVQAGTDAAVAQMTAAAIESANSLFRQIGIDAAIDSFHAIMASSYQGDRDGVASGGRLRIGDRLVDIGIPDDENPTIKGFGGWSSAETLPRLATDIQLTVLEAFQAASDQLPSVLATMLADVDVRSLGEAEAQALAERFTALTQGAAAFLSTLEQTPFAELRDLSFDAAAAMVQFAGSVDNLLSAQQTYYDRYYSEQEKFEHSVNQLSQALSGVGVVMPELTGSTEDMLASYRRLVESLDLNTEAGQQAYVVLMQSAGAFAEVATYAGTAAEAVRSAADIAKEREGLERQLLQLQGNTAELRRRELEALDESNHALQRYIWSLQDQRAAWDAAVAAGESAFSALSRSVSAEKSRLQKESQAIADALRNSISAASTTVNELTSLTGRLTSTVQRMIGQGLDESRNRAWAQERIDRALSVAKLTGVMPQGADFEQALQIVAQPSEGLFSSFEDYQADFLKTAHTVSELNELAEGQLSTEKRALKALEDQLSNSQQWYQAEMERLDLMLEQERQRLDVAMGTYETVLTIPEALAGIQSAIANIQLIVPPAASGGGGGSGASWDDLYLSAKLAELQNKGAVSHGIDWQSGTINDLAAVFASEGLTPRLHYELYGKDEGIDEWMKRLPGFAVGTNYVPYDMVARIHEGERIIPATDNRKLMQMLARGVDRDNTIRLLQQEIRELRLMMERKLDGVERNTGDTARTNRQMVEQRQIVQVEGPVATVLVEDRTA